MGIDALTSELDATVLMIPIDDVEAGDVDVTSCVCSSDSRAAGAAWSEATVMPSDNKRTVQAKMPLTMNNFRMYLMVELRIKFVVESRRG
jgi:hypothetical protein